MDVDTSELAGFTFRCIPGCGFCCNLVPGVPRWEQERIRKDPRFSRLQVDDLGNVSLPLVNGVGSCVHLTADLQCDAYDGRPEPCRLFPFHLHLLHRAQVNIDLTCRGLWEDHADARPAIEGWRRAIATVPDEFIADEAAAARAVYAEFRDEASASGAFVPPDEARAFARAGLPDPFDRGALDALAAEGGATSALDLARTRLRQAAEQEDPVKQPVHLGRGLEWLAWRVTGRNIILERWDRSGARTGNGRLPLARAALLPMDDDATALMNRYAGLLLARDHVYGVAAGGVMALGYDGAVGEALLDVWAGTLLDAWFRGSVLAMLRSERVLDRDGAVDAIASVDIDILDAPTIGATI